MAHGAQSMAQRAQVGRGQREGTEVGGQASEGRKGMESKEKKG